MEVCSQNYSPIATFSPSVFDQVDWSNLENDQLNTTAMDWRSSGLLQHARLIELPSEAPLHAEALQVGAAQSHLPIRSYTRARSLPASEWGRLKPYIVKLYIDDDRQLEDVRRIMREQHGFCATVQMYKKKFAAWEIRKNYSKEQKEEILLLQDSTCALPGTSGAPDPDWIVLNSKKVKQHRIERYRRQKDRLSRNRVECRVSPFQPQLFPEGSNVETILLEAKSYSAWCFSQPDVSERLWISDDHLDLFSSIEVGAALLAADPPRAFALFNRACSNMADLLQDRSLPLLQYLVGVFCAETNWQGHDGARVGLLEYISKVAQDTLGHRHPLSKVVSLLVQEMPWRDLGLQLGRFLLDSCKKGRHELREVLLLFNEMDVVSSLFVDTGNVDLAAKEFLRVLKQVESTFSPTHWLQQKVKLELGWVNYKQGRFLDAEREWLGIMKICADENGRENAGVTAIDCCHWLGTLYDEQGRDEEAERYYRQALEGAVDRWGAGDPFATDVLIDLQVFLEDLGRDEDVEQLRQEYAAVYAGLDDYYLKEDTVEGF